MHCNLEGKQRSFFFRGAVILVWISFFFFSSHFSKCVCVTLEAHQCLRSWVCNELMEKRPAVCWETESFLPGTSFILCLCGNITDFALFPAFVPYWQQIDIMHMESSRTQSLFRGCRVWDKPPNHNMFNLVSMLYFVVLVGLCTMVQ